MRMSVRTSVNCPATAGPRTANGHSGAALPRTHRSARSNNPFAGINRRTAGGRRIADLVRQYLDALGNPQDIGVQAQVIAAAEMAVIAEAVRTRALLEPASADLDAIVRMQRAADQAMRRLGIKATAAAKTPTLAEYLASRYPNEGKS
jgi:hypothetical protein